MESGAGNQVDISEEKDWEKMWFQGFLYNATSEFFMLKS